MGIELELEQLADQVVVPPADPAGWHAVAQRRRTARRTIAVAVVVALLAGAAVGLTRPQASDKVAEVATTAPAPDVARATDVLQAYFVTARRVDATPLAAGAMGPDDSAFGAVGRQRLAGLLLTASPGPPSGSWQTVTPAVTEVHAQRAFDLAGAAERLTRVDEGGLHIEVRRRDSGLVGAGWDDAGGVAQLFASGPIAEPGLVVAALRALLSPATGREDAPVTRELVLPWSMDAFRDRAARSFPVERYVPNGEPGKVDVVVDCIGLEAAQRSLSQEFTGRRAVDGRPLDLRSVLRVVRRTVADVEGTAGRIHEVALFDAVTGEHLGSRRGFVPGDGVAGKPDPLTRDRVTCPPAP